MAYVFLMFSCNLAFALYSFPFIRCHFKSLLVSSSNKVSLAHLKILIFLTPVFTSLSSEFIYSLQGKVSFSSLTKLQLEAAPLGFHNSFYHTFRARIVDFIQTVKGQQEVPNEGVSKLHQHLYKSSSAEYPFHVGFPDLLSQVFPDSGWKLGHPRIAPRGS